MQGLRPPLVLVRNTRLTVGYIVLVAAAVAAIAAYTWPWLGVGGRTRAACSERPPAGQHIGAAWRTAELYVADVILAREPRCGETLSTAALRRRPPLRAFSSGYPVVPIARASRDAAKREAVYMLSRRAGPLVVTGSGGRREIPFAVGLSAPDAGRGAYDLVLVVDHGNWRVDRAKRIEITNR